MGVMIGLRNFMLIFFNQLLLAIPPLRKISCKLVHNILVILPTDKQTTINTFVTPQLATNLFLFVWFCVLPVWYNVRLSHLNKDYLLTYLLTAARRSGIFKQMHGALCALPVSLNNASTRIYKWLNRNNGQLSKFEWMSVSRERRTKLIWNLHTKPKLKVALGKI